MRVAALYDVHGNLPALEAVLAEVPDDATILVGGDVAVGPFPSETLERLRRLGERVLWIRGNADRELTRGEEGLAPPETLDWVRERLSEEQIAFLHGLPARLEVEIDGVGRVLFCHATPRNDVDVFLERAPEDAVLAPHFELVDASVVVCGHTHMQFARELAKLWVVNAGSVGMPYEEVHGAYWLLVGPALEHRRTDYDANGVAGTGFPGRIGGEQPGRSDATTFFETLVLRG